MKKDTFVALKKPEVLAEDPLMQIFPKGAREMLQCALKVDVKQFLTRCREKE